MKIKSEYQGYASFVKDSTLKETVQTPCLLSSPLGVVLDWFFFFPNCPFPDILIPRIYCISVYKLWVCVYLCFTHENKKMFLLPWGWYYPT